MNRIVTTPAPQENCPKETDPTAILERYQEYLGDESRIRSESVGAVYLPETAEQAAAALVEVAESGQRCILSAGRTGITGAVAPLEADAVISLEKLNRILAFGKDGETPFVRVQPGVSLATLAETLEKKEDPSLQSVASDKALRFPVDPTEMTAHVGGVVASNASGARTYRYGPTRDWVRAITMVLPSGEQLTVRRGEVIEEGGEFVLADSNGKETTVPIPAFPLPETKATLGYPLQPGMDFIDLLIGSEGTLGMMVEVELALAVRPESVIGVLVVLEDEAKAIQLVEAARNTEALTFDAIEYFDHDALQLLKSKKDAEGAGSHIPDIPNWDGSAIYLEFSGTEEETEEACMPLEELLNDIGSSLDDTWAAMEPRELEEQKLFRHQVPEAVNTMIGQRKADHPELHKVGTDMAVPDEKLRDVFAMYRTGLSRAGLESVVFGHIGNNHVHVNLLPRNGEELKTAKALYLDWAKDIVAMGGAVAAEHGIGRIKKSMLEIQYDPNALETMRVVRRVFDPKGVLNPGVLV